MFQKIKLTWNKFSNFGIRVDYIFEDIKRIRIINQCNIIGILNTVLYVLILICINIRLLINYQVNVVFIFDIIFLAIMAFLGVLNFWIVKKYHYKIGGIFMLTVFPTLLASLTLILGDVGIEYYYFPFFIVMFYILGKHYGVIILAVYYIFLFSLTKYFEFYLVPPLFVVHHQHVFYFSNIIIAFTTSFAFLKLLIVEHEKKGNEIELKNVKLEEAIDLANKKNQEIQLLLKELSHRTKNNLQLVTSIMNIQAARITDPNAKSTIDDVRNRIICMALLHQKLYLNNNLNTFSLVDYTNDLVNFLNEIFEDKTHPVTIIKDVDYIDMKIDFGVHFGLILNELLTNSFKHGKKSDKDRFIKISVKKKSEHDILISLSDSGIGLNKIAEENYTKTFGASLIYSMVKQLDGEIYFNTESENDILIILRNML